VLRRSSHGRDLLSYLPPPAFPWCGNPVDKCVARGNDKRVTRGLVLGMKIASGLARRAEVGARAGLLVSASRGEGLIGRSRRGSARRRPARPPPRRPTLPATDQRTTRSPACQLQPVALTVPEGHDDEDAQHPPAHRQPGGGGDQNARTEDMRRSSPGAARGLGVEVWTGIRVGGGRDRGRGVDRIDGRDGSRGRGSDRASSSGAKPADPSRARRPGGAETSSPSRAPTSARPRERAEVHP
jgi:hypothetical protein